MFYTYVYVYVVYTGRTVYKELRLQGFAVESRTKPKVKGKLGIYRNNVGSKIHRLGFGVLFVALNLSPLPGE